MKNAIKASARFARNHMVERLGRAIADHDRIWTAQDRAPAMNDTSDMNDTPAMNDTPDTLDTKDISEESTDPKAGPSAS
jgi:hypothetical protein